MVSVAFQGEPGAYSEEAAIAFAGPDAGLLPCRGFMDVVAAIVDGRADRGVLPIENSIIGRIRGGADAAESPLIRIVQEMALPIRHCLLAPGRATIATLQRVLSHPAAIAQCSRFLRTLPHIEITEWYDTAGAARDVAIDGDPHAAAIASRRAAERYRLGVLVEGIEDDPHNSTKFVLVEKR